MHRILWFKLFTITSVRPKQIRFRLSAEFRPFLPKFGFAETQNSFCFQFRTKQNLVSVANRNMIWALEKLFFPRINSMFYKKVIFLTKYNEIIQGLFLGKVFWAFFSCQEVPQTPLLYKWLKHCSFGIGFGRNRKTFSVSVSVLAEKKHGYFGLFRFRPKQKKAFRSYTHLLPFKWFL